MNFVTLRDKSIIPGSMAIVSEDVLVPEKVAPLGADELCGWAELDYAELCVRIVNRFFPSAVSEGAEEAILAQMEQNFEDGEVAPLLKVNEGLYFLELWHGCRGTIEDVWAVVCDPLAKGAQVTGVNPIARAVGLVPAYFSAYYDLVDSGEIAMGDSIRFCLPSNRDGMGTAVVLARALGLPVEAVVCASTELRRTDACDEHVQQFMLGAEWRELFYEVTVTDEEIENAISVLNEEEDLVLDPETAAALVADEAYLDETGEQTPSIVVSPLSVYHDAARVLRALGVLARSGQEARTLYELSAIEPPKHKQD